jgi:hypothetical protein
MRGWTQADINAHTTHQKRQDALRLEDSTERYAGKESDLQAACDAILTGMGFARRTPKLIQRHESGFWFVHLCEAKRNPILLDYVLMHSPTRTYAEIELKVQGGRLSVDQNALIRRGEGVVCWNVREFKEAVSGFLGMCRDRSKE